MSSTGLARVTAAASVLLTLRLLQLINPGYLVSHGPDTYGLPERTQYVGLLVGWSAVTCAFVAYAASRRLLRSRRLPALALAAFAVSAGTLAWLAYADARDYPQVSLVSGSEPSDLERLLDLAWAGILLPGLLAGLAARVLTRASAVPPPPSRAEGV